MIVYAPGSTRGPAAQESEIKDVLVLSRKVGERILIGDKISITIVRIAHGGVRIGVDAPTEMPVVREELAKELDEFDRDLARDSKATR